MDRIHKWELAVLILAMLGLSSGPTTAAEPDDTDPSEEDTGSSLDTDTGGPFDLDTGLCFDTGTGSCTENDTGGAFDTGLQQCGGPIRRRGGGSSGGGVASLGSYNSSNYTAGPKISNGTYHDVHTVVQDTTLVLKLRTRFVLTDAQYRTSKGYEAEVQSYGGPVVGIKGWYTQVDVSSGVPVTKVIGHLQTKVDATALLDLTADQVEALGGWDIIEVSIWDALMELHEIGPHGDLNMNNILIDDSGAVTFIDLGHSLGAALLNGSFEETRCNAIAAETPVMGALIETMRTRLLTVDEGTPEE